MQEDNCNLLTLVLAGQPKLGKMLEDPRRTNLFQRVGVYSRLTPLDTVEKVQAYVSHRLEHAGRETEVFTNGAVEMLFEHSQGIPRLVNRLCKLALKSAETNGLGLIDGDLISALAERFEPKYRGKSKARNNGRRKKPVKTAASGKARNDVPAAEEPKPAEPAFMEESGVAATGALESKALETTIVEEPIVALAAVEETVALELPQGVESGEVAALQPELEAAPEIFSESPVHEADSPETEAFGPADPASEPETAEVPDAPAMEAHEAGFKPGTDRPVAAVQEDQPTEPVPQPSNGNGALPSTVSVPKNGNGPAETFLIPAELVEALRNLTDDRQRLRLAGQLAARQIQEHPERYTGATLDPVRAWDQLREAILRKVS
jgi:hypothetical protein